MHVLQSILVGSIGHELAMSRKRTARPGGCSMCRFVHVCSCRQLSVVTKNLSSWFLPLARVCFKMYVLRSAAFSHELYPSVSTVGSAINCCCLGFRSLRRKRCSFQNRQMVGPRESRPKRSTQRWWCGFPHSHLSSRLSIGAFVIADAPTDQPSGVGWA